MSDIKVSYLKLVRSEEKSDEGTVEVLLTADEIEPIVEESDLRRRGKLYDYVLGSVREYARQLDPTLTFESAAEMMIDFPLFISGLQVNWNGSGLVRELPNLPWQEACSN